MSDAAQESPGVPDDRAAVPVSPKTPRSALRMLGNGLIVILIALGLVEGALRILGVANPVLYVRDPDAGYRLRPSQRIRYLTNTIDINRWGTRDSRAFDTRDAGKKRILVLGDSVTWGGILERQEDIFTSIAERELRDVEIINAGVNGYSTSQMVRLYRGHLRELRPDIVIACVIMRDFTRPVVVELTGKGAAFPLQKPWCATVEALAICRQSAQERFGWSWLGSPPAALPPIEAIEDCEARNIRALVELSAELGGKDHFAVVFLPGGGSNVLVSLKEEYRHALRRGAVATGRLDQLQQFAPTDFVDRVHLSTEGHRKAGKALSAFIQERYLSEGGAGEESPEPEGNRRRR